MTPARLPEALRLLVLPWWERRAARLADALEGALAAGQTVVEIDRRRLSIEQLAAEAERALGMADRLSG
jgi:hypothetical protein